LAPRTLERRGLAVTYVRTAKGHEVDFLARSATGEMELLQVASDATEAGTAERELRALEEAGRLYPKEVRRLLTLTQDALPANVPRGIVAQPAYQWMLVGPGRSSRCVTSAGWS
jgi:predicted AAA+ superfamily ATPase